MSRKIFILSFLLTLAATILLSPLYVHHEFWHNWNEKRANIELFNQGKDSNSFLLSNVSKAVKVSYPKSLKRIRGIQHRGQGMLVSFKIGLQYRRQSIVFEGVGDGRLVINFRPEDKRFSRLTDLRTGQIDFRNVFLDGHNIKADNGVVKDIKDGQELSLTFEAKKHFDLSELWHYVDWLMLIIVTVLSFGVFLCFVKYLDTFRRKQKVSCIDIVFLSCFFLFLGLPISYITETEISERENRVFSPRPKFFEKGTFNYNYGKQYEQWFNDRFFGRDWFISFYNKVQNVIGGQGNKKVLVGRENWLYIADSSAVSMYQNMNLFSIKELELVGKKMQTFAAKARRYGVKNTYFYFSADKETLYPEYYPTYIPKQGEVSRLQQLLSYLKEHHQQLHVLNFTHDLEGLKQKGEFLFCKTGSHMSDIGSYYEYWFLVKELQKEYPQLKILGKNDIEVHETFDCDMDLYRMLNDEKYSQRNAFNKSVVINKPSAVVMENRLRAMKSLGSVVRLENKNVPNRLKVLFVADSFGFRWNHYLAESFFSVYTIFNAQGADYTFFDDEIAYLRQYKPDIIIVESAERFLQRFLNLKFPEI